MPMPATNVLSPAASKPATRAASTTMQALFAILFGALIIGVAGFSHIEAVHNAAHDTRHSNAFPCH
ncbi:cobalt transporter subunit CbtB [Faunimonas pinastri]|uniref:Cobalt transporter subunit CbtB n=1 Tax=Faunimonas pinastri TaxID=1855383 RepID=A0A1H9DFL4_9HYPH|nr:CbtB-domain containing protein [Faunimonas pinastri]SEQ12171.1 cobalt transporter subunit CbtB [Faunimonas pinastri]